MTNPSLPFPDSASPGTHSYAESVRGRLHYQEVDGWEQTDVLANQAATEVARSGGRFKALRAGRVVGIGVWMAAGQARTAGTLTVEVFRVTVNRTTGARTEVTLGLKTALDGTNPAVSSAIQTAVDRYYAGDELIVKSTTDGSWAPTTGDIEVALLLESR